MTDAEREEHNERYKIGELETEWACVVLYRGRLLDIDPGILGSGDADELAVMVDDRAGGEIWFPITPEQRMALALLFAP